MDCKRSLLSLVRRDGIQQALGIGVQRVFKQIVVPVPSIDNPPYITTTRSHMRSHDAQVMGDKDDDGAQFSFRSIISSRI